MALKFEMYLSIFLAGYIMKDVLRACTTVVVEMGLAYYRRLES